MSWPVVQIQPSVAGAATRLQAGLGCPPPGAGSLSLQWEHGRLEEEARPAGWGPEGALAALLPVGFGKGVGRSVRRGWEGPEPQEKEPQGRRQHGGEPAPGKGQLAPGVMSGTAGPGQVLCGVCGKC